MKNPITLQVTACFGAGVEDVCAALVKLARRTGIPVRTKFNGEHIYAEPSSDPDKLVRAYRRCVYADDPEARVRFGLG